MKVYKNKKRCCGACKPHKRGHVPFWTHKDFDTIERMEKEIRKQEQE